MKLATLVLGMRLLCSAKIAVASDLAQLMVKATDHAPQVQQSRRLVTAAAAATAGYGRYLPTITAVGESYHRAQDGSFGRSALVRVEQPVIAPFEWAQRRVDAAAATLAEQDLNVAINDALYATISAYLHLQAVLWKEELTELFIVEQRAQMENIEVLVRNSHKTLLDLAETKSLLLELEESKALYRLDENRLKGELLYLTGDAAINLKPVDMRKMLKLIPVTITDQVATASLGHSRALAQENLDQMQWHQEVSRLLPTFSLFVEKDLQASAQARQAEQSSARVGLSVQWTIFQGGSTSPRTGLYHDLLRFDRREAELEASRFTAKYQKFVIEAGLLDQDLIQLEKITSFDKESIALASEAMTSGYYSLAELANRKRRYHEMQLRYCDKTVDRLMASLGTHYIAGKLATLPVGEL